MAPLTTNARVYHRAGVTASNIPTTDIDEFIADAQAFIEGKAESTFSVSDSNYNLARAALHRPRRGLRAHTSIRR